MTLVLLRRKGGGEGVVVGRDEPKAKRVRERKKSFYVRVSV
jgi:hypothetical protein